MAKSQASLEREKKKLISEKVVAGDVLCPTCNTSKTMYFRYRDAVLDEHGDVQFLLPKARRLDDFIWDVCDTCKTTNQYAFPDHFGA